MADDWKPAKDAAVDGAQCALRFRDPLGSYDSNVPHFLHDDGHWYRINPPTQIDRQPTHYREL
jgi:hypothetical protein